MKANPLLIQAEIYFARGNFTVATMLAQKALEKDPAGLDAYTILAKIAQKQGTKEQAARFYNLALWGEDKDVFTPPPTKGFLLIKAWSFGFWSDVEQIMAALLFCELTGRIPVIHWGSNSYYNSDPSSNGFNLFFEPINAYELKDLTRPDFSFYPPKWNHNNINQENNNKMAGDYSRMPLYSYWNSQEDVVVYDFFTQLWMLIPFISPEHWLYGDKISAIFRKIYSKYFKPREHITKNIEDLYSNNLKGQPTIAIHIRNLDKSMETDHLRKAIPEMKQKALGIINNNSNTKLFLLSDNQDVIKEFQNIIPDRLFVTSAQRTVDHKVLTFVENINRENLGKEIITDTILATKCDEFIGHSSSNVAGFVSKLKDWPQDKLHLYGVDPQATPLYSLYGGDFEYLSNLEDCS